MASLANKVILITGSSAGIGAGIAVHLSTYKPRLVLTGRDSDNLKKIAGKCQATGLPANQIFTVPADIHNENDLKRLIYETTKHFNQLDVLVNNAGISNYKTTQQTETPIFDEIMSVNLRAPFILSRLAIPHLIKTKGTIINISSALSQRGIPQASAYCMSKAAIDHFTRVLAIELGPHRVRVNTVSPGFTKSELQIRAGMPREQLEEYTKAQAHLTCLGRAGEPLDIAKCVKFLASDESEYITGENILVDGGRNIAIPKMNIGK
ncbi:hypothetical protein LOTGIDRAFT_207716 [Lottia gigantea]|uniref:Uncharacterized protein n=1 Tax=Lottia gigantea TaxID=225164 RepID=V4CGH5_LOTGI|nr:hypothetical protein LOTGIDRAFT_207716 [Lottia gigantea]ESP01190.1 hypothetical protein LOTGIDRAFT_207716 [Lottia gigantea]